MRLKFLFFPIMLIISLSIGIGYIWPEVSEISQMNKNKIDGQEKLLAVQDKQAAIEKLGTQLTNDAGSENLIKSYLPVSKYEEKIISGINFLATDSGVSLVNLSIKDGTDTVEVSTAAVSNLAVTMTGNISENISNPTNVQNLNTDNGKLKNSEATLVVTGDYDKIKIFIDQLQKMPVYNVIKSLNIVSNEDLKQEETQSLTANITVNFGYMSPIKIDNSKMNDFAATIDSSAISVLKQYVSQKSPSVESGGDQNGKINPFQP